MDEEIRALVRKIEIDKYKLAQLLLDYRKRLPCSMGELNKWIDEVTKE